jgi:hypothetical protein
MSNGPTFAVVPNNNNNNDDNDIDNDNENGVDNGTDFDPWVTGTIAGGGAGNITDAQIEAWRERERRQRTVRSLMMFLLMLMLMDGEEQSQQQRLRRQQQQNKTGGLRGGSNNKKGRGIEDGIFTDMELYSARRMQDRSIEDIIVNGNHPRVNELIKRNDGRDVDREVRGWAEQQRSIQTRMFYEHLLKDLVLEQSDGSFVKVLVASPQSSNINFNNSLMDVVTVTNGSESMRKNGGLDYISSEANTKTGQNNIQSAIHTFDEFEEAEQEVWHYPWNATGFYRGDWMTIEEGSSSSSSSTTAETNDSFSESSTNSPSKLVKHLTSVEAEIPLLELLKDQSGPTIGVYLLPPEMELKLPNNGTVIGSNKNQDAVEARRNTRYDSSAGNDNDNVNDAPFSLRGSPSSATMTTATEELLEKISLTKSSGKAAFQLYSKSVPAMKELSLIEGVVKLYDSNTVGYSTRRDILLRVHGVLIHSLGRLSLVANPKSTGRAALIINGRPNAKSKDSETTNDPEDRRRLQELLSTSAHYDDKRVEEIRDRALNLFYNDIDLDDVDFSSYKILWSMTDEATTVHDRDGVDSSMPDLRKEYLSSLQLLDKEEDAEDNTHITEESQQQSQRRLEETTTVKKSTKEDVAIKEAVVGDTVVENDNDINTNSTNNNSSKQQRHDDTHTNRNKTTSTTYSKHVIPFPFAWDDEEQSLQRKRMPGSIRNMPAREISLQENAGSCEFVMNMNVQEERWTVGAWRKLISKHMEKELADPSLAARISGTMADEAARSQENDHKQRLMKKKSNGNSKKSQQQAGMEQAWIMTLNGTIVSPNCDYGASVNLTAIRTNWEATTGKAINYSFYMMTICLTQIVLLLKQLLHTQAQSAATRVSLLCIGWQTVVDALLCLVHIYLSLAMQPLFTAFASVAFFKLLIFCVIEMKYMAIIIQARNASNGGNTIELLRRQITMLHLRFYVALMGCCLGFFYSGDGYRAPYILVLYSFWVPQIVHNVVTEAKRPLHPYYIYGMSVTRLFAPLYIFAVQGNFLKEVYPESPTDILMCQLLVLWVGIQAGILDAQGRFGARFMIPAQFLPPKYDYSRPIPASLLSSYDDDETETANPSEQLQKEREIPKTEVSLVVPSKRETSPRGGGARNRKEGNKPNRTDTMTAETVMAVPKNPSTCVDCVICYNEIDTSNRAAYMLSPCDHIFHKDCLVQWMDVKMECPICRTQLPPI